MRVKKILEITTQWKGEIEKAIAFNKENNYEYILQDDSNLIGLEGLLMLLRNDYTIQPYANKFVAIHKNYNYDNELIEEKKEGK